MHALPDSNPPTWLGLPASAETERMKILGQRTIQSLSVLLFSDSDASTVDEHGLGGGATGGSSGASVGGKAGLAQVLILANQFLTALPTAASVSSVDEKYASDSSLSPIQRYLLVLLICAA